MIRRFPSDISRASIRLDLLLDMALDCAQRQKLSTVSESILGAMEAHAAASGDGALLDAAYLRSVLDAPAHRRRKHN